MGSSEIKIKLNNFLLTERRTRAQSQLNTNCAITQCSMSGIHSWYSGLLQCAWVTHRSCTHRSSPTLCPAPLHTYCCPWWLSHGTDISKCWGPLLHLGCTFTNRLSWAFFRDSIPTTCTTPQLFSRIPYIPSKPVVPAWLFLLLEHSFCVLPLRTHFSSQWHRSLLNHSPSWLAPTILAVKQSLVPLVSSVVLVSC